METTILLETLEIIYVLLAQMFCIIIDFLTFFFEYINSLRSPIKIWSPLKSAQPSIFVYTTTPYLTYCKPEKILLKGLKVLQ